MTRAAVLSVAVLLVCAALGWQRFESQTAPLPVLYTLGGDFTLPSTLNRTVTLAELRGHPVLLNFGYTSCPDVCPTVLARMRDVLQATPDIQPVFVTLDPQRDTLERLAPYLAFFDARIIGLTGTDDQVAALAGRYHVYAERVALDSALDYAIAHSGQIYLLDGAGRVRATFGESVTVPAMVAVITRLREEAG
jgi:protein SCO1/2